MSVPDSEWPPASGNLFQRLPYSLPEELLENLLVLPGLRVERIVSTGHSSPAGFWYDQDDLEWVVVLRGAARLRFADEAAARELRPGDFVCIAPHRRHRVEWTTPDEPTVWLAVFAAAVGPDDQTA